MEASPLVVHPFGHIFGLSAKGYFVFSELASVYVAVIVRVVYEVLKPLVRDTEACFFVDLSMGGLYGCFTSVYLSVRYLVFEIHWFIWVASLR